MCVIKYLLIDFKSTWAEYTYIAAFLSDYIQHCVTTKIFRVIHNNQFIIVSLIGETPALG